MRRILRIGDASVDFLDIAAAGGDPRLVRDGTPSAATELMLAYVYDTIARRHPVGLFGIGGLLLAIARRRVAAAWLLATQERVPVAAGGADGMIPARQT